MFDIILTIILLLIIIPCMVFIYKLTDIYIYFRKHEIEEENEKINEGKK